MRITGGMLGGRLIEVPPEGVRPTQDRVREALFSMLVDRIGDCRFLDLFAGSGAVGIEAWSRGAEEVCWVESSRPVLKVLKKNVESLCPERARVHAVEALSFLSGGRESAFDVIFADPPYRKRTDQRSWMEELPDAVGQSGLLSEDGILVVECAASEKFELDVSWEIVKDRKYGDSRVLFLVQNKEGGVVSS